VAWEVLLQNWTGTILVADFILYEYTRFVWTPPFQCPIFSAGTWHGFMANCCSGLWAMWLMMILCICIIYRVSVSCFQLSFQLYHVQYENTLKAW